MNIFFHYLIRILERAGQTLWLLLPYLLIGVLVGEVLKLSSWTRLIYRGVSKSPFISIVFAALLGMASPLCAYGTIPVVLQLFRAGVPLAPLVTFLCASSLMNPQLFIITWGGIGWEMALARTGAVFLFGLLLGLILSKVPSEWIVNPHLLAGGEDKAPTGSYRKFAWRMFIRNYFSSLQFIGFYFVIGVILGAITETFLPTEWASALFKNTHWSSVLFAALLGMPLYACGGGVIPLIRSLMEQGMSNGAALAFFLVGPATRIAPLMALSAILRPLFIGFYVITLIAFSLLAGLIYL